MRNEKNIFESDNDKKRKKDDVRGIKNIARNSGYLHDWKEIKVKRRNEMLKKLAIFAGLLLVTASITVFVNMQSLKSIKEEREKFLSQLTPAPTQVVEDTPEDPIVYSDKFNTALKMYNDVVGYLVIADTNIDFPIVQGEDNYFYENRNYDRSYSEVAATYMLTECDPSTSRHIVIYGENEDIEGRFGELNKFLDNDFFSKHEYITLELIDGAQTWQVFSVHLASMTFNYKDVEFESNTEYLAYIKMFQTMSRFDRNIDLNERDQILTLVTDYHDLDLEEGYLLVHARRIS